MQLMQIYNSVAIYFSQNFSDVFFSQYFQIRKEYKRLTFPHAH